MNFVISYSCGKDSTLALHRMIVDGHTPVGLLVMINEDMDRSWFHGVDLELLQAIADSLNIPLILCRSKGQEYHIGFEKGLKEAIHNGATACVFGDIDIADNAKWCKDRCDAVGIESIFPLWQEDRIDIVNEVLDLGYSCIIKCVRNQDLPAEVLGKSLGEVIDIMMERNIDICGENGEYHTIVLDGPIFNKPANFQCLETIDFGNISAINIVKA